MNLAGRVRRVGICTLGMDGGRSGIGRYTRSLIEELQRLRPEWRVDLVGQAADRELFGALPESWGWHPVPTWVQGAVTEVLWMQLGLGRLASKRSWEVAFMTAGNRRLPAALPCRTVGTVHDFSSLHVEEKYDPLRQLYIFKILPALVRRLDRVVAVSRASAGDIETFAGVPTHRIDVVANGVTPRSRSEPAVARRRVREELGLETPWLLYVSRLEHPGKNHVRLITAFERFAEVHPECRHHLVLAGADWNGSEAVHQRIRNSPLADRVLTPGFVPERLLADLLDGAEMLVFPSLYEGFGLPVLEAMAAGVPVACSDRSSLPEIGGEAATYFDPYDTDSILGAIEETLAGARRSEMISAGRRRAGAMTWQRAAALTASCLERTMPS